MKLRLSTWNAVLIGPMVFAIQVISTPHVSAGSRAFAMGLVFYLSIPVVVLLVVDIVRLYQYINRRKQS